MYSFITNKPKQETETKKNLRLSWIITSINHKPNELSGGENNVLLLLEL
jgi:hypothetical protein